MLLVWALVLVRGWWGVASKPRDNPPPTHSAPPPPPPNNSKPGPVEEGGAKTAANLKKGASAKGGALTEKIGYGHICLSFIFRPAEPPAATAAFRADLGNGACFVFVLFLYCFCIVFVCCFCFGGGWGSRGGVCGCVVGHWGDVDHTHHTHTPINQSTTTLDNTPKKNSGRQPGAHPLQLGRRAGRRRLRRGHDRQRRHVRNTCTRFHRSPCRQCPHRVRRPTRRASCCC